MTVRADAGFATVAALGAVAGLVAAGAGATSVAVAAQVHDRAAVAADAAAVAAAVVTLDGAATACARAAHLATRNGGRLVACAVAGPVVDVQVSVSPPHWLAWAGAATVKARAGPADASEAGTNQDEPRRADAPS